MPRYSGWGGGWPFMYMQQPGGWGEHSYAALSSSRRDKTSTRAWSKDTKAASPRQPTDLFHSSNNNNNNNLFPPCGDINNPNTDNLSGLLARLILQNHLTRLADIGCHGGALYGCGSSPSPSPSPCHSRSQSHCHGNGGGCGGIGATTSNNNRCQICVHTCPNATQPYIATNNVFVIPAAYVQQPQPAPQQHSQQAQAAGLAGANLNNINMFLNALGGVLGGAGSGSACGGGGGVSFPQGFGHPGCGAGMGQVSVNNGGFSCAACCNHFRV